MALTLENVIPLNLYAVTGSTAIQEGPSTGNFPAGPNPQNIQCDQPVTIYFQWYQAGPLTGWLTGTWKCDIFFEALSPSFSNVVIPGVVMAYNGSGPFTYITQINIPANTISEGIYRLTSRLMLKHAGGVNPNSPLAAFEDLGIVEFYQG